MLRREQFEQQTELQDLHGIVSVVHRVLSGVREPIAGRRHPTRISAPTEAAWLCQQQKSDSLNHAGIPRYDFAVAPSPGESREEKYPMPGAVSTRVGLSFGLIQLFFTLSWVIYVLYLPQLAAQAGIGRGVVPWILVLDQVIFALCDLAAGLAADHVAKILGRSGKIVAAVTAVSTLAFLLLPFSTAFGAPAFVTLIIIWSITSSALRAPPLKLIGRYTPLDQQPWIGSLFLLGIGIASVLAPFLAGRITACDPRITFAASAVSVVVVTFSIIWAEKTLARSFATARPAGGEIRSATFPLFLVAILLLAIGFQAHSFINAQPLFLKFAPPTDLPHLLSLFWIGYCLLMLPASFLTRHFGGIPVMVLGTLVAAVSALAAAKAPDVVSLGVAQLISGGAWGCVTMSAVAAALAIGHGGAEGKAVGAMFSLMAVAAMARIALVAGGFDKVPSLVLVLPWLPAFSWLGAGLMLMPATRRAPRPT
ncbi:MFS transporter [Mycobacterium sp. OTB74]|uniref:MFS transporter n=1 Tax=Mycobacterium sp. OTB74 TaxID=1853452 RepID=UPI002474AA49|nr:MFS transporter [Mycobacterium sp. OTB74]MDH6243941.1 MFS family permease [Mycobacterium sp. OTB74]